MTRLFLMYYINRKPWLPIHHHFTTPYLCHSQAKNFLSSTKHINSSIHTDLLCNTLTSIICANIVSHSCRLSSYRTQLVSWYSIKMYIFWCSSFFFLHLTLFTYVVYPQDTPMLLENMYLFLSSYYSLNYIFPGFITLVDKLGAHLANIYLHY